jgi:hypothetical protein
LPSVAEILAEPAPPTSPAVVVAKPAWGPPDDVTGASALPFTRKPGYSDSVPVTRLPRRLVVVDEDGRHEAFFQVGVAGSLTVLDGLGTPSAPWSSEHVLGRFSPWCESMVLADGRLVVVEESGTERTIDCSTRLVSPRLLAAWREPDPREPWVMVERSEGFELAKVLSLELADAEEG